MATTRAHPLTGHNCKMTLDGATIHLKEWKRTPTTTKADTTDDAAPSDFASGLVRKQQTPTMVESTFHLVGEIRTGENPIADPPNLNDGVIITGAKLYAGTLGYWNIYEGVVQSSSTGAAAGGVLPFECDVYANNDRFIET